MLRMLFFFPFLSLFWGICGALIGLMQGTFFEKQFQWNFVQTTGILFWTSFVFFYVIFCLFRWTGLNQPRRWRKLYWATSLCAISLPFLGYSAFPSWMNHSHGLIVSFSGQEGFLEQLLLRCLELFSFGGHSSGIYFLLFCIALFGFVVFFVIGLLAGWRKEKPKGYQPPKRRRV